MHFQHSQVNCFPVKSRAYSEDFTRKSVISRKTIPSKMDRQHASRVTVVYSGEKQKMESESLNIGVSKRRRKHFTNKKSIHVLVKIS